MPQGLFFFVLFFFQKRSPVSVVGTTRLVRLVESLWGFVFVRPCIVSVCSAAPHRNTGGNSGQPKVCHLPWKRKSWHPSINPFFFHPLLHSGMQVLLEPVQAVLGAKAGFQHWETNNHAHSHSHSNVEFPIHPECMPFICLLSLQSLNGPEIKHTTFLLYTCVV